MAEKIKVSCFRCGATNNYPANAEGKKVVCGRCKSVLPVPGIVIEPSAEGAANLIRHSNLPILIDFYSLTCAPCLMMHPVLERLAKRRAGEIMVVKLNVDRHAELAASFGVQAVPTFVVVHKGTERGRTSGAMPEADFSLWVASRT
jgi:thioredoxin 2